MSDLENDLTWSFSRSREFDSCLRKYYYNRYLKWGGWDLQASEDRATAYRLAQMTSVPALAGDVVHNTILTILKNYRDSGILMTLEGAQRRATRQWEKSLEESRTEKWRDGWKKFCCLMEDYYNDSRRDQVITERGQSIEICLQNFYKSETLKQLLKSRPKNWLALDDDPFATADVGGIPMFGRPDLAYAQRDASGNLTNCRIFDWKTSKSKFEHVAQVRYYVLFAVQVWGFPNTEINARLVYLYPSLNEEQIVVASADIRRSIESIAESYGRMTEMLQYIEDNRAIDLSHFPVTEQTGQCRFCNFREICTDRIMSADIGEPVLDD